MIKKQKIISFQGENGAYSDLACRNVYPDYQTLPCKSFDDAFKAVLEGKSDLAMIPVDNSIAGRVADVHNLMPKYDLFAIGEHFQPVRHNLLGIKGAKIEGLSYVHSHIHALPQCKTFIGDYNLEPQVHADTAGAAAEIARMKNPAHGAIASSLAAEIYDLEILKEDIQDQEQNVTRFLVLAAEPEIPPLGTATLASLIFEVRNIPAALYKAMGGFATNGISMTKLESYVDMKFDVAQFYCEVLAHPESKDFENALEELGFYAKDVRFFGAFPANPRRE